ncbi:helix-turn-helix domain-containing protein [Arthrobacter sp. zg-Y1110]|uniref:helix-turn-helix domain-containing protein n=1 Tax=Arthrobacter sp. zg-Y1110 TaxID=2886932 RepID=UPI001D137301|nr:helix-turn-helix transcriptional regulator [Arthrobacter sp. zg-Y1110]MCC3292267.1 helix-turn-helix domain-containing protein [Arthrobacter sp. zg-Y1110]UWX85349.1 helix-turn-helix domain-containing protein [Arthrobacter sp. zg-Y1110]
MDVNELLGIDPNDPVEKLAQELVEQDQEMLSGLVSLRQKTMTQDELAERLGVDKSAVVAFERYDADPRLSTVRRYAFALRARIRHTVTKPMSADESRVAQFVQASMWEASQEHFSAGAASAIHVHLIRATASEESQNALHVDLLRNRKREWSKL